MKKVHFNRLQITFFTPAVKKGLIVGGMLLLFWFSGVNSWATTYYVSNSGDDRYIGTSIASPWKTLSRLSSTVAAGDIILLKRGDIWREQFTVPAGGMTIGAYGTGAKPIISGADVVSGSWVQDSGEIYRISTSGPVYQVFRNGEWVQLAHEPDSPQGGPYNYFTDDVYKDTRWEVGEAGNDMIYTNDQVSGAELVGMVNQWSRNVYKIDHFTNNVIYLVQDARINSSKWDNALSPNPNRYWLANKRIFLDSENEWYFDSGQGILYTYQPGGGSPTGTWEVIKRKYGIFADQKDNITIKNVEVRNTLWGIYLDKCLSFDIDSVDLNNIGTQTYFPDWESIIVSTGIYIRGSTSLSGESGIIHNCTFNNMLREAINGNNYGDVVVDNNTITNTATIGEDIGFGPHGSSNSTIDPHNYLSRNWVIKNNTITNCGYIGISGSKNTLIQSNTIINSMIYLGDGGAIYAGENKPVIIKGNYINTTGNVYGNTKAGIYLDGVNSNCVVENNTILNADWCLFNHRGSNNHWNNNTCIDYRNHGFIATLKSYDNNIDSLEFKGNKLSTSHNPTANVYLYSGRSESPAATWFDNPSDCDYNTYYPDGADHFFERAKGSSGNSYDFQGWQSATGLDAHSMVQESTPVPTPIAYWAFDEGMDTIAHDSIGNNNGTIHGATWSTEAISGHALSFNGIDDYVDIGNASALKPNVFTLSAWVILDSTFTDGFPKIINGDNDIYGYQLYCNIPDGHGFTFGVGNGSFGVNAFSNVTTMNKWVHVVGVYDGDTAGIYINGELKGLAEVSSVDYSGISSIHFGNQGDDVLHWKGLIDEVKIYDAALSSSEVTALYVQFKPTSSVSLKTKSPGNSLGNNYPNPFTTKTAISYRIAKQGKVRIDVSNVTGSLVRTLINATQAVGEYKINWDARDNSGQQVPSGVYLCKMSVGRFVQTRKMLVK